MKNAVLFSLSSYLNSYLLKVVFARQIKYLHGSFQGDKVLIVFVAHPKMGNWAMLSFKILQTPIYYSIKSLETYTPTYIPLFLCYCCGCSVEYFWGVIMILQGIFLHPLYICPSWLLASTLFRNLYPLAKPFQTSHQTYQKF